jgi:hypothetical protein
MQEYTPILSKPSVNRDNYLKLHILLKLNGLARILKTIWQFQNGDSFPKRQICRKAGTQSQGSKKTAHRLELIVSELHL